MVHVPYQSVEPFDFKGLQIHELTPGGLGSISVAEIEVAPGAHHPTARSTKCDKIYICSEGTISFHVEGKAIQLTTRDLLFIAKNQWFEYRNESVKVARLTLIHVPPFDLESEEFLT